MSERELLLACVAFLERISHEEAGDRLQLADKLRAAIADRPEQPVAPSELNLPDRLDWYADLFPAMRSDLYAAAFHVRKSPAYRAPVARPEPAQPVAWIRTLNGEIDWAEDCLGETEHGSHIDCYEKKDGYASLALYAAPPSRPAPSEAAPERAVDDRSDG